MIKPPLRAFKLFYGTNGLFKVNPFISLVVKLIKEINENEKGMLEGKKV